MPGRIEKPRIVLLDCNLEYKKGDNQFDVGIERPEDIAELMRQEEEYVKNMCEAIIRVKPNLVLTEKGVSGMHFPDCRDIPVLTMTLPYRLGPTLSSQGWYYLP